MNEYQRIWDALGYGPRRERILRASVRQLPCDTQTQARHTEHRRNAALNRLWRRMSAGH
jgi:hypothetical protein